MVIVNKKEGDIKMSEILEESVKLAKVFGKLVQWTNENGYEIVGPSITICYDDPHTTPEEELISECPFPVRKRE